MNQKGFTLIEILAAVTILGILTVLAIGGYGKYMQYARNKAYKVMAKSVATAAEEYVMDNPGAAGDVSKTVVKVDGVKTGDDFRPKTTNSAIEIRELLDEHYLNSAIDPANKGTNCRGAVRIGVYNGTGKAALDQYVYLVDICCSAYKRRYIYSYFKKVDGTVEARETTQSLTATTCNGYSY